MDFNKYYRDQIDGHHRYYSPSFQKGYGIGSMFKKFFKWVLPVIKEHAFPILKGAYNTVKTDVTKGFNNFESDLQNGDKSIKDSFKQRLDETVDSIKRKFQSGQGRRPKKVRIIKPKLIRKRKSKKRKIKKAKRKPVSKERNIFA
jgi:hypothetical protein